MVGSARARGRRERRREKNSVVREGRERVVGPEAWRRMERVRMKRGRRGGVESGEEEEEEPLFGVFG